MSNSAQTHYTVSEAASQLGLSAATLRRWEREGRYTPRRTFGNQRYFTEEDIKRLRHGESFHHEKPRLPDDDVGADRVSARPEPTPEESPLSGAGTPTSGVSKPRHVVTLDIDRTAEAFKNAILFPIVFPVGLGTATILAFYKLGKSGLQTVGRSIRIALLPFAIAKRTSQLLFLSTINSIRTGLKVSVKIVHVLYDSSISQIGKWKIIGKWKVENGKSQAKLWLHSLASTANKSLLKLSHLEGEIRKHLQGVLAGLADYLVGVPVNLFKLALRPLAAASYGVEKTVRFSERLIHFVAVHLPLHIARRAHHHTLRGVRAMHGGLKLAHAKAQAGAVALGSRITGIRLPSLRLPEIKIHLPKVHLPSLSIPKPTLPSLNLPRIEFPSFSLPSISLPTISVPRVSLPHLSLPKFRLSLPPLHLPHISLPTSKLTSHLPPLTSYFLPAIVFLFILISLGIVAGEYLPGISLPRPSFPELPKVALKIPFFSTSEEKKATRTPEVALEDSSGVEVRLDNLEAVIADARKHKHAFEKITLTSEFFSSLDSSKLTGKIPDADHLDGISSSSFLRADESDTAEGAINFTAKPGGSGVGGGPVYINPAGATAGYTLFGVAVGSSQRFKVDAEGDVFIEGDLQFIGAQTISTNTGNLTIDSAGSFVVADSTTFQGTLTVEGASTFASDISVSSGGQLTLTRNPTQAHTGTWAIGSSTWNASNATIYVNPASPTADSNIFALAKAGSVQFAVDAEGDVYANNLVLTGSTTTGTTTVAGDLSVEGNTTLGDTTTDTLTINPATFTWAGGNKTLDLTGAATRTLTLLNSTASQVADLDLSDGSLKVGGTEVLSNARSLNNIAALDATTETIIEAAIDTLANLTSAAALATVGTITTGVWQGTAVADAYVADDITLTSTKRITTTLTTEQLRLAYDASNYLSFTVGSTGAVTLNATGAGAAFTISDDLTLSGTLTANGAATFNTDVDLTLASTENLAITNTTQGAADLVSISPTWTGDNTADALSITTTYNLSTVVGTQYGLNLTNADNGVNTGVIDALALFSNDQATETLADGVLIRHNAASGTLTDALQIENTTAGGTITNAINILETAGTITTGINLGAGLTTGIDAGANIIVNIGNAGTDFSSLGGLTLADDLTVTGGDITLGTTSIFSGGDTASLNNIDAIDATTETTIEAAIDTLANLTSAAALATVGTITTGVWTGTSIADANVDNDITITSTKQLKTTLTTAQLSLNYDASNYVTATVGSTGVVTLDATGAGAAFTISDALTASSTLTVSGASITASSASLALGGAVTGVTTLATSGNITVGSGGNTVTISTTAATAERAGTARRTYRITLTPEYPGGLLTADGTSNTGTMTSDFCSNTAGSVTNVNATAATGCPTAGDIHNFYNWTTTSGTAQDYDIFVRLQIPDDFDAWASSNPVYVYGYRSTASDGVTVTLYDTAEAAAASAVAVATGTATWTETSLGASLTGTWTTGDYVTFLIKLTATNANYARVGEIRMDYLSRYK